MTGSVEQPVPAAVDSAVRWTDVVTALATVGGALATVATLIFFGFQLRTQLRQIEAQVKQTTYMEKQTTIQAAAEEARHLQVRRQQASKIIVKMHRVKMRWWRSWWSLRTRDGVLFDYVVENRSGIPCYFTYFEVFDGDEVHYRRLGTLDRVYVEQIELSGRFKKAEGADRRWPYFRITFMDAANVFWMRDSLGQLGETSYGFPPVQKESVTLAERRALDLFVARGKIPKSAPMSISDEDMRKGRGTARAR